jgi:hypothetical protein
VITIFQKLQRHGAPTRKRSHTRTTVSSITRFQRKRYTPLGRLRLCSGTSSLALSSLPTSSGTRLSIAQLRTNVTGSLASCRQAFGVQLVYVPMLSSLGHMPLYIAPCF